MAKVAVLLTKDCSSQALAALTRGPRQKLGSSPTLTRPAPRFARTLRDHIVWWETGGQLQQLLADGEVAIASAWNGRVQKEIDSGTPVEIQWNQNLQTADYLVVPKGTSHKEEAMRLIAYCVSGENNHRLSEYIEYAPINKESIPKVDPQVTSQLPTAYRDVGVRYNAEW